MGRLTAFEQIRQSNKQFGQSILINVPKIAAEIKHQTETNEKTDLNYCFPCYGNCRFRTAESVIRTGTTAGFTRNQQQ